MNLLHLDSSILGPHSVSRTLSSQIVARLVAQHPDAIVVRRDLAADPLPHLSGALLAAGQSGVGQSGVGQSGAGQSGGEHDPALRDDLAQSQAVMREFQAADVVVIGVAFYNFSIPTQLKAWIDRVLVAGQTFRYNEQGRPEGLVGGKRVILAVARGGFYGPGAPTEAFEHAETYLRATLGFIGINDLEVVVAEGLAAGPANREAGVAAAQQHIAALAA